MVRTRRQKIFDSMDLFAAQPPQFNIEGQTQITTSLGFLFSALLIVTIFGFSIHKSINLFTGNDPKITKYNFSEENKGIDLADFNYAMAFRVSRADENYDLNDTDYVEWFANIDEVTKNGIHLVQQVGIHKCSYEELK